MKFSGQKLTSEPRISLFGWNDVFTIQYTGNTKNRKSTTDTALSTHVVIAAAASAGPTGIAGRRRLGDEAADLLAGCDGGAHSSSSLVTWRT